MEIVKALSQKSAVNAGTFLRDLYHGWILFKRSHYQEFGLETELNTITDKNVQECACAENLFLQNITFFFFSCTELECQGHASVWFWQSVCCVFWPKVFHEPRVNFVQVSLTQS